MRVLANAAESGPTDNGLEPGVRGRFEAVLAAELYVAPGKGRSRVIRLVWKGPSHRVGSVGVLVGLVRFEGGGTNAAHAIGLSCLLHLRGVGPSPCRSPPIMEMASGRFGGVDGGTCLDDDGRLCVTQWQGAASGRLLRRAGWRQLAVL